MNRVAMTTERNAFAFRPPEGTTMNRVAVTSVSLLLAAWTAAEQPKAPATAPAKPVLLSVAVLDFECKSPDDPDLGRQIAEVLSVTLSMDDRLIVVERTQIKKVLQEQGLTLSGAVDNEKAVKVGKIIGAKLLITGRLASIGKNLHAMCKVISSETTQQKGCIKRFDLNVDHGEMIDALAKDLLALIQKEAPVLIPLDESAADRVAEVKKKIAAWQLPTVAVDIPEQHLARAVADPAAQTEIIRILRLCGYVVIDTKGRTGKEELRGVDVLVKGEAISELGGRIEGLVSSGCRVEFKAVETRGDKVLIADRHMTSAVHLSEHMAAKSALQKAGHELGYRLAEELAKAYGKPRAAAK